MLEIFERVTIFTTKPVIGQYRFKDTFQIYPSKRKPIQHGRFFYPLVMEISFPQQGERYDRYGAPYGSDQLTKQIVEMQHLLSVVTQFFFFDHIKADTSIKRFTNKLCQLIAKGKVYWYQDKALDDYNVKNFVIPEYMDSFFETYYALSRDVFLTFRKACYLFYCGIELRGTYHSLSFASFVSAIETLMAYGAKSPERCKDCGQPKYRLNARFREFIITFGFDGNESTEAKKFTTCANDFW